MQRDVSTEIHAYWAMAVTLRRDVDHERLRFGIWCSRPAVGVTGWRSRHPGVNQPNTGRPTPWTVSRPP